MVGKPSRFRERFKRRLAYAPRERFACRLVPASQRDTFRLGVRMSLGTAKCPESLCPGVVLPALERCVPPLRRALPLRRRSYGLMRRTILLVLISAARLMQDV